MIDTYTRILELAAETGDDKVADDAVTRLIAHLTSTGRSKLLPSIGQELKKIRARRLALAPKVEVASEAEAAGALQGAAAAGIHAETATINPSLIRGWRASGAGRLVDHSGKRALIELYKKVIT